MSLRVGPTAYSWCHEKVTDDIFEDGSSNYILMSYSDPVSRTPCGLNHFVS